MIGLPCRATGRPRRSPRAGSVPLTFAPVVGRDLAAAFISLLPSGAPATGDRDTGSDVAAACDTASQAPVVTGGIVPVEPGRPRGTQSAEIGPAGARRSALRSPPALPERVNRHSPVSLGSRATTVGWGGGGGGGGGGEEGAPGAPRPAPAPDRRGVDQVLLSAEVLAGGGAAPLPLPSPLPPPLAPPPTPVPAPMASCWGPVAEPRFPRRTPMSVNEPRRRARTFFRPTLAFCATREASPGRSSATGSVSWPRLGLFCRLWAPLSGTCVTCGARPPSPRRGPPFPGPGRRLPRAPTDGGRPLWSLAPEGGGGECPPGPSGPRVLPPAPGAEEGGSSLPSRRCGGRIRSMW